MLKHFTDSSFNLDNIPTSIINCNQIAPQLLTIYVLKRGNNLSSYLYTLLVFQIFFVLNECFNKNSAYDFSFAYNLLGEELLTLVDEDQEKGYNEINFNASGLASGVYLYRINSGSFNLVRKMLVIR